MMSIMPVVTPPRQSCRCGVSMEINPAHGNRTTSPANTLVLQLKLPLDIQGEGRKMEASFKIPFCIIASLLNAIGILTGVFIVTVNLVDWIKGRKPKTCDLILVAIGMSSACYQCTRVVQLYATFLWKDVSGIDCEAPVLTQILIWTGCSSFWFTACLCVFYCVKIVDFSHHLFFWVKLRISNMVPWMLLGSVVGSGILSIHIYCYKYGEYSETPTANCTANSNNTNGDEKVVNKYVLVVSNLGFCMPLLFGIASIILILISLCRHTQRIQGNTQGVGQPRLKSHFNAAKMVATLLLNHVLFLVAQNYLMSNPAHPLTFVFGIIITFSTSAQSSILILGNTKLKQALRKALTTRSR